jgi:hypothetical protein
MRQSRAGCARCETTLHLAVAMSSIRIYKNGASLSFHSIAPLVTRAGTSSAADSPAILPNHSPDTRCTFRTGDGANRLNVLDGLSRPGGSRARWVRHDRTGSNLDRLTVLCNDATDRPTADFYGCDPHEIAGPVTQRTLGLDHGRVRDCQREGASRGSGLRGTCAQVC